MVTVYSAHRSRCSACWSLAMTAFRNALFVFAPPCQHRDYHEQTWLRPALVLPSLLKALEHSSRVHGFTDCFHQLEISKQKTFNHSRNYANASAVTQTTFNHSRSYASASTVTHLDKYDRTQTYYNAIGHERAKINPREHQRLEHYPFRTRHLRKRTAERCCRSSSLSPSESRCA